MSYDITKPTAPKMPALGKGTECIKILLSQTSKDMHEPLVPIPSLVLGAHVSGSEFQYPDLSWKELCGQMANLVAESGGNKGQLSQLVEAICHDFRQHDVRSLPPRFHRGNTSSEKKPQNAPLSHGSPARLHLQTPRAFTCTLPESTRADSRGGKID